MRLLVIVSSFFISVNGISQQSPPPFLLLSSDRFSELHASGVAERIDLSSSSFKVYYLRIESFAGDSITTRDEMTSFQFVEIDYIRTLPRGSKVTGIKVTCINIDWQGRLDQSGTVTVFDIFTREAKFISARNFHREIPSWAKRQLYICSGYLNKNPGSSVVDYFISDSEMASSFFVAGLSLLDVKAPRIMVRWIGNPLSDFLIAAGKELTSVGIKSLAAEDKLRWGVGNYVAEDRLKGGADIFLAEGKRMWSF